MEKLTLKKVEILDIIFLPNMQLRTLVDASGNVTVNADYAHVKHPNQAADFINSYLNSTLRLNSEPTLRAKIYGQLFTSLITPAEYVAELLNRTLFASDAFLSATFQVMSKLHLISEES